MQQLAEEYGVRVAGIDHTGEMRAVERPDHPFFVGTL
jgi:CTP synthase (UTP-ammonia lyase)